MSASDEEIPGRELAYRLFATEYDDASLSHADSDEERAPNYVITPTGARINRLFVVGTLTEVTAVNDEMVRARVVDPTGAFVVYAGQYQPDELATLENLEPPAFVAVTGKARTFQPDDSDQVYTSIRPESIATVDADTRDRWVVSAAEATVDRIGTYAAAAGLGERDENLTDSLEETGVETGLAAGIPLARDHYRTTPSYLAALRDRATEAVEVVAGDRDQVEPLEVTPDESQPHDATLESLSGLAGLELGSEDPDDTEQPGEPVAATTGEAASEATTDSVASGSAAGTATGRDSSPSSDADEPADLEEADETTPTVDEDEETAAEGDDEDEEQVDDEPAVDAETMDGGMYEMDDEERQQIEEEFGAEFSTGAEVDSPGEADIDVPEADDEIGSAPTAELEDEPEADDESDLEDDGDEADLEEDDGLDDERESDDEPDEDVDLQEYVVETMTELDDGEGVDRTDLVEAVTADLEVEAADVEDAIQNALMDGQCYEPDDETLQPI